VERAAKAAGFEAVVAELRGDDAAEAEQAQVVEASIHGSAPGA
jgi:hypothetical protein